MKTVERKSSSNTSGFLSGVFVLSFSTVIVKIIGLLYKIPMFSVLGAEGMGYLNSAYEIYALLCVISTAGLPVALSILVSSYKEKGDFVGVKDVYKCGLRLFLFVGALGTLMLIIFAKSITEIIKNNGAYYSILAIAPSLLFVCISSAVRGYFQGHLQMLPTAVSQLIESVSKLIFGILFSIFAINKGYSLDLIVAYAILGISLGTLISAAYLLILKGRDNKRYHAVGLKSDKKNKKTALLLLKIALPITISSAVISVTRIVDMALIMRRLQNIGYSSGVANEIYGLYTTIAVPIFSLVPSLLTPISLSLVPALSATLERGHGHDEVVKNSIKLTVFFALPASLAISLYSSPIISLLFSNVGDSIGYVSPLLALLGPSVLFSCLTTTSNAILQAERKVNIPIISMAVGALIKIISAYVLIGLPEINVFGAPISTLLCDISITVINFACIFKLGARSVLNIGIYLRAFVSSLVSTLSAYVLFIFLNAKTGRASLSFLIVVPITVALYFIVSFVTGSITFDDVLMFPKGEKICRLLKIKLNKQE